MDFSHGSNLLLDLKVKIKLLIFTLFLSSQIFGQSQKDSIVDKSNFIEYSIITNSCKDMSNWTDKKNCSLWELVKELQESMKQVFLNKLPMNKYRIRCTFYFDSNGELINSVANTENDILNAEVIRVLKNLELNICLMDENGNNKNGEFSITVFVKTEKKIVAQQHQN